MTALRTHRSLIPWYAGTLCVALATVAILSATDRIGADPALFALLLGFVVALDLLRIDLFERGNVSPASIPTFALAFFFGPLGPIAAELGIATVRRAQRTPPVKIFFDLGCLGLAGVAAAGVLAALPTHSPGLLLVAVVAAAAAYYVVNSVLMSALWWMHEGVRPLSAWRERVAWLWPHYAACGLLAGLLVLAQREIGLWSLAIFALPVIMLWIAEKQYVDRARSGVAQLREKNAELQAANRRLQNALDANEELLASTHRSYLSTITSLARTIEAKDPYTGDHTERVADIALALARELGFSDSELRAVQVGAVIHDIGKIGIPDSILLKPGRLSDQEFADMRRHPEISTYILGELELPPIVEQMARSHHERFDGTGYPDHLAGEQIPLCARILTVADAFDAMTSDRPYREALDAHAARGEIHKHAGSQFCPSVVAALEACWDRLGMGASPPASFPPDPVRPDAVEA